MIINNKNEVCIQKMMMLYEYEKKGKKVADDKLSPIMIIETILDAKTGKQRSRNLMKLFILSRPSDYITKKKV
jgi:hypothetical protein